MEPQFHLGKRQKVRMISDHLSGFKLLFLASILAGFLSTAAHALTPQVIRFTVDSILKQDLFEGPAFLEAALSWLRQNPVNALWLAASAVLVLAVLRSFTTYLMKLYLAKGSQGFVKQLRDALYHHIQHLDYAWHTAHSTGDLMQRCTSDVNIIQNFVCRQLPEVVRISFLILLYLVMMFTMDPKLSLVSLGFIPLVGLSSWLFYKKISYRFQEADEAEGALTTCAQENLAGVRVVRAFGRERYELDQFDRKNQTYANLWIRLGRILAVYWASGSLLTSLQVMVIILVGVVATVNGRMTLGTFYAFITYNASLSWPVRALGRVLADMSKAGVSMDRVGYILTSPMEEDVPQAETPDLTGDIVFDHVRFAYEQQPVLEDLSFTIPAGKTFAILGNTGSGKSTLVHLLDRLYLPDSGKITIGGVDIRNMQLHHLRNNIGLVLQEPYLFSQTIQENIAATHPDASLEQVRAVSKIACVDEAISEFPEGYDTIVGERGVTLSGGQKQRVAIARMLLQQAPIMIFDDSLSAVDAETDVEIREALRKSRGSSTMILISHRITTLMQADCILVLDHGKVSAIGTHDELIQKPGIYRDIYNIQISSSDRELLAEGGKV